MAVTLNRRFLGYFLSSSSAIFILLVVTRDFARNEQGSESAEVTFYGRGTRHRTGTVWPMPQGMVKDTKVYVLSPTAFRIQYTSESYRCPDIDDSVQRYMKIIFAGEYRRKNWFSGNQQLRHLNIHVSKPCEDFPKFRSSETYVLVVKGVAILTADTQWGVMRGLETFSQLVHLNDDGEIVMNGVAIEDFPRFPHRGLMLDTARHFLPVETLIRNLDIMTYNKMNVLHWHMTDDESFPIRFEAFPEISTYGAFNPDAVYTENDIKIIVEYARKRGIRVIPEIDFPGHSKALSKSHPELYLACLVIREDQSTDSLGTLDPLNPAVYQFAGRLYSELQRLFPSEYIHVGADEVSHECWRKQGKYETFAAAADGKTDDIHTMMIEGLLQEARKLNLKPIVWDDAFNHGYTKTPATVQVWTVEQPEDKIAELTDGKVDVIISYPWYLDETVKRRWTNMYAVDPTADVERVSHVLGGEACAWSEHIDANNIFTELWPLTSVVAERLWSHKDVADAEKAKSRLHNFVCALKSRGVEISPIAPGHCVTEWS